MLNNLDWETYSDRMPAILNAATYDQLLTDISDNVFALLKVLPAKRIVIHQCGKGMKLDDGGWGIELRRCPFVSDREPVS